MPSNIFLSFIDDYFYLIIVNIPNLGHLNLIMSYTHKFRVWVFNALNLFESMTQYHCLVVKNNVKSIDYC
jgi:hypothetical protein